MQVNIYKFTEWVVFTIFIIVYYLTFSLKDSVFVLLILLVMVVVLSYCEYRRVHRFNSPIFLWYCFWLAIITIGRMDLKVYVFNTSWDYLLLNYVTIGTCVFFVGYWIGESGARLEYVVISEETTDWDKFLRILQVFLLIGIFAYLLNVAMCGYIPQFSGNVNVTRSGFVTTFFYKIVNALRCMFIFVPIGLKFGNSKILKRRVLILSGVLFILEMLSGWRGYTFQALLMIITSYFITSNINNKLEIKKNKKMIIIVAVFAVIFIGYIFITRAAVSGSTSVLISYVIKNIYLYFAPNFLNLRNAIRTITPKGYPLYSTEAIWSIFVSPSAVKAYENINQNIGAYNVSTYMLQPYADLGLFGVVLCTALLALLSGLSYKKSFQTPSILWITVLGIMNVTIFTMHNGFFLRASSALFWLVIGCFIQWYVRPSFKIGIYDENE